MRNQIKPSPIDPNALFIFEDKELEKGLWTIMYKVKGRNSDGTIDYKKLLIGVAYKSNPSIIKLPFLRYFDYLDETGTPFASYDDLINAFGTLLGLGASAVAGNPAGSDKQVQFNDAGSFAGDTEFLFNKATKALTVGTSTEEASAIGNFDSTTQGFLVPRMTTAQKNAIVSPVNGLQVYDTDLNEWQYYNGTSWVADTTTPAGNNMEIQYNDSGSFGASNKFTWDNDNRYLNISTEAFNQYYRIKLGLDVGFGIIGSGLIEKIGNSTFYGAVADGNRTGFSVPGNTSGSGSGRIIPLSDLGLNLDFGSSSTSQRWGTIYSLNVDTSTSLSSVRHIVGSPNSDQSAIFLVNSTTQGVLMPRMTTAQRDAIATPSVSLLIYNTTTNKYEYNNTPLQTSGLLTIGKVYHIYDYNAGDDFTNVGATSNATGEIFTATGTTPTTWTNGSSLGIPDENWISIGDDTVAGSNMQIQYNENDTHGASARFTWDNDNRQLNISPDQTISAQAAIKLGQDLGISAIGSGLIEQQGNYTFYGGVSAGVRHGFLISGNSAGATANQIIPVTDNLTDLGTSLVKWRDFYGNAVRVQIGNFTDSIVLGTAADSSDNASAILNVGSSTKGVVLPRHTNATRANITKPAKGLIIYNTDKGYYEYNDTPLQTSGLLTIGKVYHIYDYNVGDDFTNVGAASNATGEIFTATGTTPTTWTNGSSLGIPDENWITMGANAVGGNDTEIQYNNAGFLDGDSGNVWDNVNKKQTISDIPGTTGWATEYDNAFVRTERRVFGNTAFFNYCGAYGEMGGSKTGVDAFDFAIGQSGNSGIDSGSAVLVFDRSAGDIFPLDFSSTNLGRVTEEFNNIYATTARLKNIRVATTSDEVSALVQIDSTSKGMLIPRMTTVERDAIVTPAVSLLIFNTTTNQYEFNNTPLQTSGLLTIGKVYHIYDYQAGDDFTNVGAALNQTGQVFTATGTTPATWTNSSSLGIPSENWNPLGGSSPLAVTQTVASVSDNRMVKTDGAGRVIQETGVTLTDGNQIIGDNIFEETEQTASFTLTGSMASKHIDLNSATDAILTFPQQTTEALDSGYYVSVTNKNIGVWTIAVEGSDTLQGVDIVKQNETALIKLDAAGSPQNITVIGGHITVLDNLMRFVDTVADQDYTVLLEGLQPGKITSIITQSDSGTCTLTGKINGVALGGTANSVSTLTTTQTHTTSNTFGIGDKLLFTISANVACVGMSVQFNIEYD